VIVRGEMRAAEPSVDAIHLDCIVFPLQHLVSEVGEPYQEVTE
jgi:hypothetical protein